MSFKLKSGNSPLFKKGNIKASPVKQGPVSTGIKVLTKAIPAISKIAQKFSVGHLASVATKSKKTKKIASYKIEHIHGISKHGETIGTNKGFIKLAGKGNEGQFFPFKITNGKYGVDFANKMNVSKENWDKIGIILEHANRAK